MHSIRTFRLQIVSSLLRSTGNRHLRSTAIGCKSSSTPLACPSDVPTNMKRCFINSKKAKDQPLYENSASSGSAGMAPLKQSTLSGDHATAVSCPKELSDPVVSVEFVGMNPRQIREQYEVFLIPSLELTQSKEPSSTCILWPSTCSKITNTPGFYTPLPSLKPTDVVSTKNTPNMGVGLFAKHGVNVHEVIFSERPLLVFPWALAFRLHGRVSEEEAIKQYLLSFEKIMQQALRVMTKEDVDAFMSLSNSLPNNPPLHGIARSNTFGTGTDIEENNLQEGKVPHCVVGRLASRINHSCAPNVHIRFDIPTFSLRVIALREIKAGEQLFYCYCSPNESVKKRRKQLATYGFECQCKACTNATPESDKLREEITDRIQKVVDMKEEMFANPGFNLRSLDPLLKLEKDIVDEGLDVVDTFVDLLYIIFQAYKKLGNIPKQIEYFIKGKKCTG